MVEITALLRIWKIVFRSSAAALKVSVIRVAALSAYTVSEICFRAAALRITVIKAAALVFGKLRIWHAKPRRSGPEPRR